MIVNYQLHTSELNEDWIASVKAAFPGKAFRMVISDAMDENETPDDIQLLNGIIENTQKPL